MPRAAVGTPKYLANAMKAKGLQKLRWFCQVCEKQCRDENGFKCHVATESHLRQMLVVGEQAGKHISDFSGQFQAEFVTLLSRRFGTNRIKANNVYQEYIQDRNHLHMNSTRWLSLTEFIKHLGREGVVRVEETEKGFFISWVDNSPMAMQKAEAHQKKERAVTSDEQRERTLISEQISRATAEASAAAVTSSEEPSSSSFLPSAAVGLLQREEGAAPVRLSFGPKKSASPPAASTSTQAPVSAPLKMNPLKMGSKTGASNPLKGNVFKAAKIVSASSSAGATNMNAKRPREVPAAQRLIIEEQERKKRRMGAV